MSLVEVLVATLIVSGLAIGVYDSLIASNRALSVDRVSEVKRRMSLDLIERFAHPYSDIELVFPKSVKTPAVKQLTIDEAMELVAVPAESRMLLKAILSGGHVVGFTLAWSRGLVIGAGKSDQLRLDKLWVHPVVNEATPGASGASFRMFYVRS